MEFFLNGPQLGSNSIFLDKKNCQFGRNDYKVGPWDCYKWSYIWMFPKIVVPPEWKTLLKWMIWGYPYFWKHPFDSPQIVSEKISPWSHLLMQWQWTVSCGQRRSPGIKHGDDAPPLRNQQRIINKKQPINDLLIANWMGLRKSHFVI